MTTVPGAPSLVVIGGGSAGYAAALRAAELGSTVTIVERDRLGGTCLHRGCIPTKALLHVAETADAVAAAERVGVRARLDGVDMAAAARFRTDVVARKFAGLQALVRARGIRVIAAQARLAPDGSVHADGDIVPADDVLIATGARTRVPAGVSTGGRILTSDTALELDVVPRSAIVVGGGAIGIEFASAWRSLGAQVTIVEAQEQLLPAEDELIQKGLARGLRARGIVVRTGTPISAITGSDDGVSVDLDGGEALRAEYALVAVGRDADVDVSELDAAGIRTRSGSVEVDDALQTSRPRFWAAGDVVRGLQLAHRGFQQGIFVAEQIAGRAPQTVPDALIPRIVYSAPETAAVGITRRQAVADYGEEGIAVIDYNLAGNARTEILGMRGAVRVIRRRDGPLLGVHMVGPRVSELIGTAQVMLGWEAHPEDAAGMIAAHPTQSEALGEALLALAGKPLHVL